MDISQYVLTLDTALSNAGKPEIAIKQAQYMRNKFSFYGLMRAELKSEWEKHQSNYGKIKKEDTIAFAKECIQYPNREIWYLAVEILKKNKKTLEEVNLNFIKELIVASDWWDIVDLISSHNIGTLAKNYKTVNETIQNWMYEDNFWLRRASIIYQLTYRHETDADFLFQVCRALAHEKEFFIRKAIGWALREYSKWNPTAVRHFVETHQDILSPLSIREASKYI